LLEQTPVPKKKSNLLMIIVLGVCLGGCLCVGVVGAILFPVFAQAKEAAITNVCASNMRKVGAAIEDYTGEMGAFPGSMQDVADRLEGDRATLKCPKLELPGYGLGFAYHGAIFANKKFEGLSGDVLSTQPLLIEVQDTGSNLALNPSSTFPKRHNNGRYVNAYFAGIGVKRLRLTDAQMNAPIMSVIKELRPATTP
jgi:hypothetical protein